MATPSPTPTLSSTSVLNISQTGATIGATPNVNGTLYGLVLPSSSPALTNPQDVANNASSLSTTDTANVGVNLTQTGLMAGTSYVAYIVQKSATGTYSIITSIPFTTTAVSQPAPSLSSITATYTNAVSTTCGVTTNKSGTIYCLATTSSTAPSAATIKSQGQSVSAGGAGTYALSLSGLSSNTGYYLWTVETGTGGDSAVAGGTSLTTLQVASNVTTDNLGNLDTQGGGGSGTLTLDQPVTSASCSFVDGSGNPLSGGSFS